MKLKVGMIGCGSITEFRHAPEYKANENVEIAAFCDPQPDRADRLAQQFGGKVFCDYRDLLELPGLDAVSVCTSNNTHANITIEALDAGKHVLCEKPMATGLSDARAMVEASRRNKRFLMIGHNQRLARAHIKAKEILESGELGKILSFRTCFAHAGPEMWSADKGSRTWFFQKNAAAMGALGDLAIHKADLIRWLISDEIDEVCAALSTVDKRDHNGGLIEMEDNAICILKSRLGVTGSLIASWTNYGREENYTDVYCEKGILKIFHDPDYELIVEMKNRDEIHYRMDKMQTNEKQAKSGIIDSFVQSLLEGKKPDISGEQGFEALSIIMACLESNEKKSFVKVEHY